jgi:zinc protease
MRKLILATVLLACGTLPAAAGDVESRVTEFTLKNGLPVLVYLDSTAPVVTVATAYHVGSVYEATGYTGLSHMLEHMAFQRSNMYKSGEYFRIVKAAGGQNNGFTSDYMTAYYDVFSRANWELGMKLEAARMGSSAFTDSDFASEHQVVAEEQRLGENNPTSVFWRQFNAMVMLVHPTRNPTVGWADDVAHFTTGAVRDWYRRYYSPTNAILVVAGDIRPESVKVKSEQYFGRIKSFPVNLPDFYNVEPKQAGERRIVVHKKVLAPKLGIAYHAPGIRDSAYYPAVVAGGVLGQGRGSRLYQRLVKDSGLATGVYVRANIDRDPGQFTVFVDPKAESLTGRIERIVYAEIDRLGKEPITERELQRVKNQTVSSYVYDRDATMWMAINLASAQLIQGSWREFKRYPEKIGQVTADQVQGFCRNYLTADNRTVGLLLPEAGAAPQSGIGRPMPGERGLR